MEEQKPETTRTKAFCVWGSHSNRDGFFLLQSEAEKPSNSVPAFLLGEINSMGTIITQCCVYNTNLQQLEKIRIPIQISISNSKGSIQREAVTLVELVQSAIFREDISIQDILLDEDTANKIKVLLEL